MTSSKKLDLGQLGDTAIASARQRQSSASASAGARPRLIRGLGQKRPEPLTSRQAVVRVLIEAAADLLLRRISTERAEEIRVRVDQLLGLFDRVDRSPQLVPALRRRLDELEAFMRETRRLQTRRVK